jgi:environmental stress-induced protein Ves
MLSIQDCQKVGNMRMLSILTSKKSKTRACYPFSVAHQHLHQQEWQLLLFARRYAHLMATQQQERAYCKPRHTALAPTPSNCHNAKIPQPDEAAVFLRLMCFLKATARITAPG